MIIEADNIETTQGVTIQRLSFEDRRLFWACMYLDGQTQLIDQNVTEETEPIPSAEGLLVVGGVTRHCFGSDDYEEFVQEVSNRGLIMP